MCGRTISRPRSGNGKKSYFSREKGGKRELKYSILKLKFRGFQNGKTLECQIIGSKVAVLYQYLVNAFSEFKNSKLYIYQNWISHYLRHKKRLKRLPFFLINAFPACGREIKMHFPREFPREELPSQLWFQSPDQDRSGDPESWVTRSIWSPRLWVIRSIWLPKFSGHQSDLTSLKKWVYQDQSLK